MTNHFCTLFDANYLSRGLTMFDSLKRHCRDFHLYIFAFDDRCYRILNKMALDSVTVISLKDFEDEQLLEVKPKRSQVEYFWTCTPSIIKHIIEKHRVDSCTYLDADLYFFDSPDILLAEIGNRSVLITEHRYTPRYDQTEISGKYCVQFMTFRNDQKGMAALNWWRAACLDWCYAVPEKGKHGDQKYLDGWTTQFEGIHELQHLGGGVAPWNVQQYRIFQREGKTWGIEKKSGREFPLIFYHFHYLRFFQDGTLTMGVYKLDRPVRKWIYDPYIEHLKESFNRIKTIDGSFDPHGSQLPPKKNWETRFRNLKRLIRDYL